MGGGVEVEGVPRVMMYCVLSDARERIYCEFCNRVKKKRTHNKRKVELLNFPCQLMISRPLSPFLSWN